MEREGEREGERERERETDYLPRHFLRRVTQFVSIGSDRAQKETRIPTVYSIAACFSAFFALTLIPNKQQE